MKPDKLTALFSDDALSDSIVSSGVVFFLRACNTFINDPSAFPIDVSSSVKKEGTVFDHRKLMGQLFVSPQPNELGISQSLSATEEKKKPALKPMTGNNKI
uniref:Uncharacterized protein n=1 Tax=Phocoena sinus TaxID=42100 RepID=A0A8C9EAS7_PHOSS